MGTRFQILLCALVFLAVLFTFVAPTLDLQQTALRSKHAAESIFLGLVLLAMTVVGMLRLRSLSVLVAHPSSVLLPILGLHEPEVSCTFLC